MGICTICPGNNGERDKAGGSFITINKDEAALNFSDSNGNVRSFLIVVFHKMKKIY